LKVVLSLARAPRRASKWPRDLVTSKARRPALALALGRPPEIVQLGSMNSSEATFSPSEIQAHCAGKRTSSDIVGRRFGRLTAVGTDDCGKRIGCVCDCGQSRILALDALEAGATRSCGCEPLSREQSRALRAETDRRRRRLEHDWRPSGARQ
jgi:hypothetical protein